MSVTPQGALHLRLLSHVASPGSPELSGLLQVAGALFDLGLLGSTYKDIVYSVPTKSIPNLNEVWLKMWNLQ